LGLRCAGSCLHERANDATPGELNFEIIVAVALRALKDNPRGFVECFPGCRPVMKQKFRIRHPPGLVRHAADGNARFNNAGTCISRPTAIDTKANA